MQIKSIVAGAAIVVAATIGSAFAADQFSTIKGIAADALTPQEMGEVTGAALITVRPTDDTVGMWTTFEPGGNDVISQFAEGRTIGDAPDRTVVTDAPTQAGFPVVVIGTP